ncbi:MAG: 23S rRNA maturation-related 3'-5' exoribonuclease YhaM [Vicingaceae bacterium]|jgi:23S rRNA maturation-related 3'-5' exoribonuclease YhaM
MGSFSDDFLRLEQNVRLLIQKNKQSEQSLSNFRKELEELKEKSIIQEKEIEELVEKNKILRIAGGSNEGSSREVKFKINEIVREVDKCIAQLNQ